MLMAQWIRSHVFTISVFPLQNIQMQIPGMALVHGKAKNVLVCLPCTMIMKKCFLKINVDRSAGLVNSSPLISHIHRAVARFVYK